MWMTCSSATATRVSDENLLHRRCLSAQKVPKPEWAPRLAKHGMPLVYCAYRLASMAGCMQAKRLLGRINVAHKNSITRHRYSVRGTAISHSSC
jgi:hypothetical protein